MSKTMDYILKMEQQGINVLKDGKIILPNKEKNETNPNEESQNKIVDKT